MRPHTDAGALLPCKFCGNPPGQKIGPPALARCINKDCEGSGLGADTLVEWNARQAASQGSAGGEQSEVQTGAVTEKAIHDAIANALSNGVVTYSAVRQAAKDVLALTSSAAQGQPDRDKVARVIAEQLGENFDRLPDLHLQPGFCQDDFYRCADALSALSSASSPAQAAPDSAAILENCDKLHDLGFEGGWNSAVEECAKLIEQKQESITETSEGSERSLSPRMTGNQMGLAYSTGIRGLAQPSAHQNTPEK